MELLNKYVNDPQVAIAANDDFKSVQISDFESDNRVDEHIRSVRLVGEGGANDGESYDLILYAAARKIVTDAMEKRSKKGYLFLYADEPIMKVVDKQEVKTVFGDSIQANIPIAEIIEEARRLWNVFVIFPRGGYEHAHKQYVELFGEESVIESQHPKMLCELIASTVGLYEDKVTPDTAVTDLVSYGVDRSTATALVVAATRASGTELATSGAGRAARL